LTPSANPLWEAAEAAGAVGGKPSGALGWRAAGVAIDSRTIRSGDLFIALKGPLHDGHDHVAAALAAGAAAAIVSRRPAGVADTAPLILVADTFAALEALGHAGRDRATAMIVAVTGSVGKTGTKEMLRLMLSAAGQTHASEGSFNNHWGVPLSLARLPPEARFGVFELGMNHAGELGPLSCQVRPQVALITNVEAVHLEFFASVATIVEAKAEIFLGMDAAGTAVLNRDNIHFARLAAAARERGVGRILSFGSGADAEARLTACVPSAKGSAIEAEILGRELHYHLGTPGRHLAVNSLGALLAVAAAGGDTQRCADTLARYQPPPGRGAVETLALGDGEAILIDDSYNASPAAVRAAIRVLSEMVPPRGGRRLMALGDMLELGEASAALHAGLAADLAQGGIDRVYCCGRMMVGLYEALPPALRGAYAEDSARLAPAVAADIRANDIITVKGSKAMLMPRVIAAIRALA